MIIVPRDNTPKSRGNVKVYSVYGNEEAGMFYYIREAGMDTDKRIKKYFVIQEYNGKADNEMDEFSVNELIEFFNLEYKGIKTEEEIMREAMSRKPADSMEDLR